MKHRIGFHVSISGGVDRAFDRARGLGCGTFQIFTGNPRSWTQRNLTHREVSLFLEKQEKSGISPVASHISYLPNFATQDEKVYERSLDVLLSELERCRLLRIPLLVIHPGKTKGISEERGLVRIARALDRALELSDNTHTLILLETTAGQGTELGCRIEHLERIIRECVRSERLGVCIDTAHLFQAGYPIHQKAGLEEFISEFEERIGWERVRLVHLNDSKTPFGSRVDRHWHIGYGRIGMRGFEVLLSHPKIKSLPLVMETPWGEGWDRRNLETVRGLLGDES